MKAITRDARLVPGAGATEMQLIERLTAYGDRTTGVLQYAIKKYGEAFEVIPRTLAESAGLEATETLSKLYSAHHKKDNWTTGVNLEVRLTENWFRTLRLTCNRRRRDPESTTPLMKESWICLRRKPGPSSSPQMPPTQCCRLIKSSLPARLEVSIILLLRSEPH